MNYAICVVVLVMMLTGLAGVAPPGYAAQADARCFAETGQCIRGRIREFWEENGGLPVFGLPITAQQSEVIEGATLQVQWFERNRLELHPQNPRPYDVLLGRLGVDRLQQQGRDWQAFPPSTPQAGCRFFAETGHNICGALLAVWEAHGLDMDGQPGVGTAESLALLGLPLSDAQVETLGDGQSYTVQWFERARLELHPQNAPPFNVQFGLLATELRGGTPASRPAAFRYVFPVRGAAVNYGPDHHDYPATDIFCPTGSEFVAVTDGVVDFVSRVDEWEPATNRPELRGGLSVAIIGDDGWRYYGSHLSGVADGIAAGQRIAAGQVLGWTGSSGNAQSTPPHLHFGISHPTTPDDWAVRRGQIPPYAYLRAWERGEMLTPRE